MPGFSLPSTARALVVAAIFVTLTSSAQAQPQQGNQFPSVRLFTVSPPGGKQGTTVEVTFTGADLDSPSGMLFSHPGIKAVAVIPPPPPPPKEDPKAKPDPKKPETKKEPPPPPPVTKFTVTVAGNVPPGNYDVRLVNKYGVSNPRVFVVGTLPEVVEKEDNNDVDKAQRVELGTTISGAMNNNVDVDYFVFAGKKGQRVVVSCVAASIDSRLTPEIRLLQKTDATGEKELIAFRASPLSDGVLDYTLTADGDYLVRLNQFTYLQANQEYFYRLTISTGPWIDAVHPPMLEPGKPTTVTVYGKNLPGGKIDPTAILNGRPLEKLSVTITAPKDPQAKLVFGGHVAPVSGTLDGFEYRLGASNPFLMTFAQAPVVIENDANDTSEKAQEIPALVEVAGRVDKKRDRDWYVFSAKKGDVFTIELYSQRLGAPTDMTLAVRNLATKQDLVLLDDTPEVLSPKTFFNSHRDPPPYRFECKTDGKYHILISSHVAELQADPTHYYRLRITPEKQDFRLIVLHPDDYRPDACSLGQAASQNLWVHAQRQDGFKGEINLSVEGLPMGVTCRPQTLGPGQKQTMLVITSAENVPAFTGEIKVRGMAKVAGQTVIRDARPASVTWPTQPQQNIPAISRLDRQLMLAVRDKSLMPYHLVTGVDRVTVSVGDKVNIPVKLVRHNAEFKGPLQVQLVQGDLPQNITFGNITLQQAKKEEKKMEMKKDEKKEEKKDAKPPEKKDAKEVKPPPDDEGVLVVSVASNVVPGTYNLVFRTSAQMSPAPKGKSVNVVLPSTPVSLLVLPKQVASLSVNNGSPALKPGTQAEVIVKVNRLHEFDGPFKVKLVPPPEVKDLIADEVTIPAGQSEVKLILRTQGTPAPGNRANVAIQATAVINGNVTLVHETKITVNITK